MSRSLANQLWCTYGSKWGPPKYHDANCHVVNQSHGEWVDRDLARTHTALDEKIEDCKYCGGRNEKE